MRFLSCFSGIEATSIAWLPLGMECVGVAENAPFPSAVLAHHYPEVPNLGAVDADDFLERAVVLQPDVLVGGPPCQDFSVAGFRVGIYGDRGNLTLRWVQIIHAVRPVYAVTENVPGWLSANDGHAFGAFCAKLVGHDTALIPPASNGGRWTNAGMVDGPIGRLAWRILDAQYFGLAQRRRRVFVVFCFRDRGDPASVLFECQSMRRDFETGSQKRQKVAPTISSRPTGGGGLGTDFDLDGGLIAAYGGGNASGPIDVATCCLGHNGTHGRLDFGFETFVKHENCAPIAFALRGRKEGAQPEISGDGSLSGAVRSASGGSSRDYVATTAQTTSCVRRLMPIECERLQGFPDNYTFIPWRKGMAPDGQRYKATAWLCLLCDGLVNRC